jgi:hypothetical protein
VLDRRKPGPAKGAPKSPPWRTPEREAQLRADWGTPMPPGERVARLAALPGPPIPVRPNNIRFWAEQLGLGPIAALTGAALMAGAIAARQGRTWRTPAREAIMREMWPTWATAEAIRARLDAVDVDRVIPAAADISTWAAALGIKRPAGFRWSRHAVAEVNRARGVAAARERVAEAAPAEVLPVEAPAVSSVSPIGRGAIPALPAAGDDGVVRASFGEVRAWALFFGIRYDGTNMDQVNRRRLGMRLPPITQCERRTAAERGEAA